MRKEFVYSAIALGIIPVTVNAQVNAYEASSVLAITSATDPISITGLAKGGYTLKSGAITAASETSLNVTIKNGESAIKSGVYTNGQEISLSFNLESEQDITITLTCASGYAVGVPGLQLALTFDFATLANNLQKEYDKLSKELDTYSYSELANDRATYGDYQTQILKIKDANGTDGYDVYKNLQLYNYTSLTEGTLFTSISTARTNAQGKEKTHQKNVLGGSESEFTAAKTTHEAFSDYLKTTPLSSQKTTAQDAYDAIDGTLEKTNAAKICINTYVTAVNEAKKLGEKVTTVETYISDSKNNLISDGETKGSLMITDATYGDIYKDLRSTVSNNENTGEIDVITTNLNTAKTAYQNSDSETIATKKTELESAIVAAQKAATEVVAEYQDLKAKLDKAYDTLKEQQKSLDDVANDAMTGYTSEDIATEKTTAQGKIDDLKTFIQNNDTKATISNLADLSTYVTAIQAAVATLKSHVAPASANKDAYDAMTTAINGKTTDLTTAKDNVAAYAKDEKGLDAETYKTATLWNGTISDIESKISTITSNVNSNKTTATTYQTGTEYTTAMAEITTAISNFETNAKAAADIYAKVSADVATVGQLITEITNAAQTKDVWTEKVTGNDRTPYKGVIETITSKKTEVAGHLISSLSATTSADITKDENHLGYLNNNKVTKDILESAIATLTAMKENLDADQTAYEAQRDAQVITNIKNNIKAQAEAYNTRIATLETKVTNGVYGAPNGFYAKKVTDALVPIKAAISNALKADGTATELTKVFEDLKALDLDDVTGNDLDALETLAKGTYTDQGNAYNEIYDVIKTINIAAQVTAAKANDPDCTYYTTLLKGDYTEELEALKTEVDSNEDWSTNKGTLKGKAETLKTKIEGVPALATANLNAYNDQTKAYDSAIKAYEAAKTKMEGYPSGALDAHLTALKIYKEKFDNLKATADTEYQQGKSATNGIATEINNLVADMEADVALWTDPVNYDAQITKDNKAAYDKVIAAHEAAQATYVSVSAAINAYNALKSTEMKAASKAADNERQALYEYLGLGTYSGKLQAIRDAADKAYTNTTSPAKFNENGTYETQFQALVDELNDLKNAFLKAIKTAINEKVNASINTYTSSINASKEKAYDFSATDKQLTDAEIGTGYTAVDGMLASIKDAFGATELDVKKLDDALYAAEQNETGINSKIVTTEQSLAQTALGTLISQLYQNDAYTTLGNNLTDEQKNEFTEIKTDKEDKEKAVSDFSRLKTALVNLINAATNTKKNSEAISTATTALADVQTNLTTAYTTIDGYAGGITVKPTLDGVQAEIDAVGEITLSNASDVKTKAADLQKIINKAVSTDLYEAELAAVNSLLAQAKEAYITYSSKNANATSAATILGHINAAEKTGIPAAKAKAEAETPDIKEALTALKTIETTLATDVATMTTDNGTVNNTAIAKDLNDQLTALSTDINTAWSSYPTTITSNESFSAEKNAIDNAITSAQKYVTDHADNISTYKAAAEAKIADIKAKIEALKQAVQQNNQAALDDIWTTAQETVTSISEKVTTLKSDLEAFGATSNYSNKLTQLTNLAANAQTLLNEKKAEAEEKETYADKKTIADAAKATATSTLGSVTTDYNEIFGAARNAYVTKITDDLNTQVNAIIIDAKNFTTADKATLDNDKTAITTAITTLDTQAKKKTTTEAVLAMIANGQEGDGGETPEVKSKSAIEQMITDLRKKIKDLALVNEDSGVKGHINPEKDDDQPVDTGDLMALVDILINGKESTASLERCDLNNDGDIDISDLIILRYYCVHGNWPTTADLASARAKSVADASMDVSTVSTADGITRVAVNLESSIAFQAVQMDVNLPEGAVLKDKSLGERVADADLLAANKNTGTIRMMILSTADKAFSGTEGAVLYLDIENLQGEITLSNVTLTDTQYKSYKLGDDPTAIERIKNAVEATGRTIYNLGGKVINGLKKGINIIRNADGTTKKVVVK